MTGRDARRRACTVLYAALSSPAVPSLRLGEAAGEFTEVTGADQLAGGRLAARRQCPVLACGAAAPDPPVRVLAPEPLQFRILVVPPRAPVMAGGGRSRHRGRRADEAGMAARARRLPPSRRDRRCRKGRKPGGRGFRRPGTPRSPGHPAYHRAGPARSRSVRRVRQGAGDLAAPQGRARPGGGPGPARDEALTQVTARRAGPVTRLPSARPRPATPCQPTAVVRTADMTSVALPTGPAAFQQCLGRPALSAGSPSMHGPVNSQFAGLSIAEQAVRGAAGSAGDRQSPGPVLSISAGESQAMTAAVTYAHDRMLP